MLGGALDPKLGKHVWQAKKIARPLLVSANLVGNFEVSLISANLVTRDMTPKWVGFSDSSTHSGSSLSPRSVRERER